MSRFSTFKSSTQLGIFCQLWVQVLCGGLQKAGWAGAEEAQVPPHGPPNSYQAAPLGGSGLFPSMWLWALIRIYKVNVEENG